MTTLNLVGSTVFDELSQEMSEVSGFNQRKLLEGN